MELIDYKLRMSKTAVRSSGANYKRAFMRAYKYAKYIVQNTYDDSELFDLI